MKFAYCFPSEFNKLKLKGNPENFPGKKNAYSIIYKSAKKPLRSNIFKNENTSISQFTKAQRQTIALFAFGPFSRNILRWEI